MKYSSGLFLIAFVLFFSANSSHAQHANWQCLGPDSLPAIGGDSSYFLSFTRGIGRTSCIRFHSLYNGTTNNTVFAGTPRGGLWRSYTGEDHWQEMNTSHLPNIGISDLIFHPDDATHLFLATGDPDAGLDPNGPAESTEDTQSRGIFESLDDGRTWSDHPLGVWYDEQRQPIPDFWNFPSKKVMRRIFIHPLHPEVMLAIVFTYTYSDKQYHSFVYRSVDKGRNWFIAFTYTGDTFQDMETKPGNPDVIYVSGKTIFKSSDAGATWKKLASENFPPDSTVLRCKVATCAADPNMVYALFVVGRTAKLYTSTDEGTTFTLAIQGTRSPAWRTALAVDPNDKYSVYYSSGNLISRFSYDRNKWSNTNTNENIHSDIHELDFAPNGKKLYVSSDGGLYVADNRAAALSWKYVSSGISNAAVWRIGISEMNPDHIIAGLQDCGTLLCDKERYASSGGWAIVRGGDGMECFIDYTNDSIMYHNDGQNNIFARSGDGGKRWVNINPPGQSGDYVKPALIDPVDHNTIYVGFHDIYKSTDRGKTWNTISNFSSFGKGKNERITCIVVAPSNHKIIYAAFPSPTWSENLSGKLFRTTDGGANWQDITPGLTGAKYSSINALAVDPNDADAVYVGFRGGWDFKIMRSQVGGTDSSWQNYSEDLPKEADVNAIAVDKRKKGGIYIGTHQGVYERKSSYSGWIPFIDGSPLSFPNVRVTDLEINYTSSELVAATLGRGVWKTTLFSKEKKKNKKK